MQDFVPKAVIRAAETRAAGGSWTSAAAEAGWELAGLRAWIRSHEKLWYRELFRARRDARDAACDEAVATLRKQLRAEEAKTNFQAASALTSQFAGRKSKPQPAKSKELPAQFRDMLAEISEGQTIRVDLHIQASEDEDAATASTGDSRPD